MANIIISGNKISGNEAPNQFYNTMINVDAVPAFGGTTGVSGQVEVQLVRNVLNKPEVNSIMMFLVDLTAIIDSNRFIRGTTTITNYIYCNLIESSFKGILSKNFFDSTTINGSNEALISAPDETIIYDQNINLVLTKVVPWNFGTLTPFVDSAQFSIPTPGGANLGTTQIAGLFVPKELANGGYVRSIAVDIMVRSDASTLTSGPSIVKMNVGNAGGSTDSNALNISSDVTWQAFKNVLKTLTIGSSSIGAVNPNLPAILQLTANAPFVVATAQGAIRIYELKIKYSY